MFNIVSQLETLNREEKENAFIKGKEREAISQEPSIGKQSDYSKRKFSLDGI